ncbi:monocarboxylate transporter 9-like [Hyalella azteca]|uniref:Monocarboxylate transporter 9-like n=1 Tax=Hyalella azteca TaxID=294128 RepID=A0A979FR16_HYAAZ|nr:monocarboxylate transporter 9-like [Hyalella azteca]
MSSFSASSSLSSGIFTLHLFFYDLGSLICPDIASKLGHRSTTFVALVTAFFSFVLLALCDGLGVIFTAYGVVLALSGGFLYNVTLLMGPMYFEKYRRPALSCITVGMGASGVISPHLVRYLIDFYGYSGGLLLYGACFLQACVLVALVRPARMRPEKVPDDFIYKHQSLEEITPKTENCPSLRWNCSFNLYSKLKVWLSDKLKAMKNEKVFMMVLARSLFQTSCTNFYSFLPFILQSNGFTPQFSAQCLANSAIMGTLVRIVVTLTVNHQRFRRKTALCVASIIAGVLDIGFIFSHGDEHVLTALSVVHGFGVGIFSSIFYAILIDIVGLELYPQCLAVLAIVLAVTGTSMSPILDFIAPASKELLERLGGDWLYAIGAEVTEENRKRDITEGGIRNQCNS